MGIGSRALRRWSLEAIVVALVLAFATAGGAAGESLTVTQFSPQGVVKQVRQVIARFSQPMVSFGDPRLADPFEIDCAEPGAGRWVDSRTWAYDFKRDLPAGVRCRFQLRSGLTSPTGNTVSGQQTFTFSTGGPAILSSMPSAGSESIEEEQAFVLNLDAEATESSILAHAGFSIEGLPQRAGVRLMTGAARDAILKTFWRGALSEHVVVLQARQRFPSGTKVNLVWGEGIAAASGVATGQDQVLEFQTRPAFTAELRCERVNARADCIPLTPMRLRFSAPVSWEQAQRINLIGPDQRRWSPAPPSTPEPLVDGVDFRGPFPERASLTIELPPDLRDDAGRPLANSAAFPLAVKTDPFPPLAKFSARFGIIESKADPALPVTLRNLEPEVRAQLLRVTKERVGGVTVKLKHLLDRITGNVARVTPEHPEEILPWLRRVGGAPRTVSVFRTLTADAPPVKPFTLPKPNGAKAFEVVGIPLESPGLYIVELASPTLGASLLGREQPLYVPTAALVTNLSVHFKWGRENSLVWVTSLDKAKPVAGAKVTVQDCQGKVRWSGETDGDGIARIDGLPGSEDLPRCYEQPKAAAGRPEDDYDDYSPTPALSSLETGLLVVARTDDDLSFVHSSWNDGIEPWRFQLPTPSWRGPMAVHTIFDRTLFRAGETVHMKHILRDQTLAGFAQVPAAQRPTKLLIQHQGSNEKYDLDLQWDASGIAESTWQIPKQAKLGQYQVIFSRPSKQPWRDQWTAGSFRVEEFRVPLMKAVVQLPAEPPVAASQVPVDLSAQYLAGGAAAKLPVILRAQIRPKGFRPALEFEHFTFANGAVKEGVVRSSEPEDEEPEGSPQTGAKPGVHQRQSLILDEAGTAHTTITDLPPADTLRELLAELEFRDPNGEVQTVSSTVSLWPAKVLAGIKAGEWISPDGRVQVQAAVVDVRGRPVPGVSVRIDFRQRQDYSYRKRLVGGFYAYEHVEEIGPVLGTLCSGTTDVRGLLLCDAEVPGHGSNLAGGNLILEASAADDAGRVTTAHADVWVPDSEGAWFRVADSDRIDVIPEKPRYEPGDTARLQVRMPFREATALVTTEREGIMEARVVRLSGKDPVVQVPVAGAYAPNMFVSVLAVRGRVGGVQPTAMVDLGKPAFKLGIAEIRVGWGAHELKVNVTSDRPTYRVRDKAAIKIAVRTPDGKAPPPGSELALAAVDEGLLELQPNDSWDLLQEMMGRRGYGVQTATAQMQVVGKRHFGLKALPQGGGGGRQSVRELFDTLLLWRGRVALDSEGNAAVEVPLNDSLTSFRIVAVATAGAGEFGTGATSIRSTQDLMILPAIAPLVREEDQFRSEVTVRNTTDHPLEVTLSGRVDGLAAPLAPQTLTLAAGEAQIRGWDLTAPIGVDFLRYDIEVGTKGGPSDHVRVTQQVRPAVPVRTFQATLARWEHPLHETVERPADAVVGRGGVRVDLAPNLTAGLDSVRDWMRRYPYTCLEQRVSRAVALGDGTLWQEVAAALPSYQDADGLLKFFPSIARGSDVLTAYVLAITHEAGLALPPAVQDKMESALQQFVEGSVLRESELHTVDLPIRKLAAVAALARVGKAKPALLGSITIEPNLWPTSAVLDWWTILRRVDGIANHDSRLREVEQIVRSRLNLQGTTMGFSTERNDGLWWLMVCPDTNPVRLVIDLLQADQWREDLPRLMRGAIGRQQRGAWDCTVSNAWGVIASSKFSQTFESTPVTGTTSAAMGESRQESAWTEPPQDIRFDFPWPAKPAELTVDHAGTGSPWVTVQSRAAIPLKAPLSSGYHITKTVTPIEPREPGRLSRGDLLRVRLEVEAQSDMTWVVVNDPIPAGASHLGTGLARDSQIATEAESLDEEHLFPAFEERAFDGYRAYYRFVPKGHFVTEYTIRLNQTGRFGMPPTRVEALYAPEMFGELPNQPVEVQP